MTSAATDGAPEPAERAAILAEWERLRAEPRPAARPPYGCATVLAAAALLLLLHQLPPLTGWEPPAPLRFALFTLLAVVLAGGLFFALFAGSGKFAHDSLRAQTAIEWLAANQSAGDPEERRRHAVALLFFAVTTDDGPTTSATFDPARARDRLGANLSYVLLVERLLAAERGLWPVFGERPQTASGGPSG